MRFVTENPESFEKTLLQAKETLIARINEIENEIKEKDLSLSEDDGDRAAQSQYKSALERLDRAEKNELEKIDAALDRIHRGEYGKCLSCGENIGKKRLKAMPYASQCMECLTDNYH